MERNKYLIPDAIMRRCPVCGEERTFHYVGWDSLYRCGECRIVVSKE